MVMLKDPSVKYNKFQPIHLPNRQWPSKTIDKPPRWLSTDLRDGNQSLPDPMSVEQKKEYFLKLVEIGFKEIEVAFPSASQIDYDFTRWAVLNAPLDVSIQVLSPCREELIKRTVESLKGAKKATVHIYLATSDCFRNIIFGMSQDESLELATKCTKYVRQLTKDDPAMQETEWDFEFSPETFSDTSPEFALRVCESVKEAWGPTLKNPIIFNLPATVEMSTPNVYADQIEYFSTHISERETVCISLHPHNDRGCAVAAAELAQMGGADRVEGCLFGNGERTGNVDLVTLALNLYTQGIYPNLDFSDINAVVDIVERCNKIPVHPRTPYGGQLVVCAFSGSHQDAIKKGFKNHEKALSVNPSLKWEMPYLPIDPNDIGRTYEAIIRVNSQSGKGGASWIILRNLELDLPRGLQIEFSKKVQKATELKGKELISDEIVSLFYESFILNDDSSKVKLVDYDLVKLDQNSRKIDLQILLEGKTITIQGQGNGPLSAFTKAISDHFGLQFSVLKYHEHSLGEDSDSKAATYIECSITTLQNQVINKWGVGIHEDISQASYLSLISILNSAVKDGIISI